MFSVSVFGVTGEGEEGADQNGTINARINAAPFSDFEQQVFQDHPELYVAESKVVASMLLKCAEFTARISSRNPASNTGNSQ